MTVGERIKYRRIELKLSQDELAARAGYCGKSAISRLENIGNDISMKQVKRLAEALDCSMAYLMGWENAPDVQEALNKAEETPKEKQPQPIENGLVNMADIPKAMELFEKYQNASPEIRAAVEVLLKSPRSDV